MQSYFPQTLEEAGKLSGEYRAGGTDVQARQISGIQNEAIIDLGKIEGLAELAVQTEGQYRLGAMMRITELAENPQIRSHYSLLAEAAGGIATPQIRNMSTLGGALLQRSRCPYFREPDFECLKRGDENCGLRASGKALPLCFDLGPCAYPHPSTLGMVLLAYDAQVELQDKSLIKVADLYGQGSDNSLEHTLKSQEILTAVWLPKPMESEKSAYFRLMNRSESEWPLIECAVRLFHKGNLIEDASITVGGIATVPLRLTVCEEVLKGQPVSPELFEKAALAVSQMNYPIVKEYKWTLLPSVIQETLSIASGIGVA